MPTTLLPSWQRRMQAKSASPIYSSDDDESDEENDFYSRRPGAYYAIPRGIYIAMIEPMEEPSITPVDEDEEENRRHRNQNYNNTNGADDDDDDDQEDLPARPLSAREGAVPVEPIQFAKQPIVHCPIWALIIMLILVLAISGLLAVALFTRYKIHEVPQEPSPTITTTDHCDCVAQGRTASPLEPPSAFCQCHCGAGSISEISDSVEETYTAIADRLRARIGEERSTAGDGGIIRRTPSSSCEPANMALFWLAENREDDLPINRLVTRFVLAYFHASFMGNPLTHSKNWVTTNHECTWSSVECDANQNVIGLSLSKNHLDGVWTEHMTQLLSLLPLASLTLSRNALKGPVPFINGLKVLDVRGNSFSGSIPQSVESLGTTLEFLDLGENNIYGSMPKSMSRLTNLQLFHADYNSRFKGSLLVGSGWTQMTSLSVDSTGVGGTLPTTIGLLTNLRLLELSSTNVGGTLPHELGHLSQLGALDVHSSNFSGTIPTALQNLHKLTNLFLHSNGLTGSIPKELERNTLLKVLLLGHNHLTGTIPTEIGLLTRLEMLGFENNFGIKGSLPSELLTLPNIEYIHGYSTSLSGTLPAEACELGPAKVYLSSVVWPDCDHHRSLAVQDASN